MRIVRPIPRRRSGFSRRVARIGLSRNWSAVLAWASMSAPGMSARAPSCPVSSRYALAASNAFRRLSAMAVKALMFR